MKSQEKLKQSIVAQQQNSRDNKYINEEKVYRKTKVALLSANKEPNKFNQSRILNYNPNESITTNEIQEKTINWVNNNSLDESNIQEVQWVQVD